MTAYEDHILHAPDVCNNCFALIREERVDPTRSGFSREYESRLTHRDETTEDGFHPSDPPTDCHRVFCECGVASPRHRIWDYTEPDRERFKSLLQNTVRTLERKDVTIDRRTLVGHAIQAYDQGKNIDGAIEAGLRASLATAVSADRATAD